MKSLHRSRVVRAVMFVTALTGAGSITVAATGAAPVQASVAAVRPGSARSHAGSATFTGKRAISRARPVPASPHRALTSSSSSASYIHDADGRLLAMVEPGSDAYVYRRDPAGNILSVTHQPAGLSILRVSPLQARPGQVVHVFGTGFSATAANDNVTIGGTATATPTVVSPVQLDVTMPTGSAGAPSPSPLGRRTPVVPRLAWPRRHR